LGDPVNWIDPFGLGSSSAGRPANRSTRSGLGPYNGYFGNIYNDPVMRNDYVRREPKRSSSDLLPKPKDWRDFLPENMDFSGCKLVCDNSNDAAGDEGFTCKADYGKSKPRMSSCRMECP